MLFLVLVSSTSQATYDKPVKFTKKQSWSQSLRFLSFRRKQSSKRKDLMKKRHYKREREDSSKESEAKHRSKKEKREAYAGRMTNSHMKVQRMNQSTKSSKVKVTIFLTTTNVRMMFNKEETYTVFRPNIFLEQSFVIQMSERMKIEKYFTSIT